jgi:hypothetical protein
MKTVLSVTFLIISLNSAVSMAYIGEDYINKESQKHESKNVSKKAKLICSKEQHGDVDLCIEKQEFKYAKLKNESKKQYLKMKKIHEKNKD